MRYAARRRRPYGTIFVLSLLVIALAWVAIPMAMGKSVPDPIALWKRYVGGEVLAAESGGEGRSTPAPGDVRVLVSGRRIPAYSKLVRDDVWNATRGSWAYTDVAEDLVESAGILVDVGDIVGRVLAHEKAPGYAFTEKDFLPEGTRPGLSAGVPAGKRALRIEVDKVRGIVGLQPGDRFDIVAALSLDETIGRSTPSFAGLYSEAMTPSARYGTFGRARVEVLVQNGVVVTPLETRQVPITNTSLTRGTSVRTIPVQEMVIALAPEEVAGFMEALSVEASVTCLARSGHPDDPLDSSTPSSTPELPWTAFLPGGRADGAEASTSSGVQGMAVIESIDDEQRALVPVPGARGPR